EVQARCPAVLVIQLPPERELRPRFVRHLWALDQPRMTREDRQRAKRYHEESQRKQLRQETLSLQAFLGQLDVQVRIGMMESGQLGRVAQLTQRTNQFNLTTIRRDEKDLQRWCQIEGQDCLTVQVSDRFGDYGLVGVILFATREAILQVDTFLLSCRALGRGVEYQMLAKLGAIARERGRASICLPYRPSGKNALVLAFLQRVA